jgi:putative endonuclease
MYKVYILYSKSSHKIYIGQTNDLEDRFRLLNLGRVRSTAPYLPWELIGYIDKPNRSESVIPERKLKNLNREDLEKFILKYFNINL